MKFISDSLSTKIFVPIHDRRVKKDGDTEQATHVQMDVDHSKSRGKATLYCYPVIMSGGSTKIEITHQVAVELEPMARRSRTRLAALCIDVERGIVKEEGPAWNAFLAVCGTYSFVPNKDETVPEKTTITSSKS